MRRIGLVATVAGGLLLIGAMAFAFGQEDLPKFLPGDEQVPVQQPEAGQQVSVLVVDLESDGERVRANVVSQQVIASFAPKVVARSQGEWQVRVLGGADLIYQIRNPLTDIEVENPDDEKTPFESVEVTSYRWTLIVPLYDKGEPLQAETIEVVDLETGVVILSTSVSDR